MILTHVVNQDDLAEAVANGGSYEDIVNMFVSVDEIQSDSAFTDMVLARFLKRRFDNFGVPFRVTLESSQPEGRKTTAGDDD